MFEQKEYVGILRSMNPLQLYASFSHGDANLENFLTDAKDNVWVIDFFYTRPLQHVLRDVARMWCCVCYVAVQVRLSRAYPYPHDFRILVNARFALH